jgi:hypothetical protein
MKMVASEFSRAARLKGKSSEVENCILRAKELLGVLESNSAIPARIGLKLLSIINRFTSGDRSCGFKYFYDKCMRLSKA